MSNPLPKLKTYVRHNYEASPRDNNITDKLPISYIDLAISYIHPVGHRKLQNEIILEADFTLCPTYDTGFEEQFS